MKKAKKNKMQNEKKNVDLNKANIHNAKEKEEKSNNKDIFGGKINEFRFLEGLFFLAKYISINMRTHTR